MTSVSSPKWTDDELLAELRDALQDEPVDDAVIRAAREAFSWRMTDADIEFFTLAADYDLAAGPGLRLLAKAGSLCGPAPLATVRADEPFTATVWSPPAETELQSVSLPIRVGSLRSVVVPSPS